MQETKEFNYESHSEIPDILKDYVQTVAQVSNVQELDIQDVNSLLNLVEGETNECYRTLV
jgi:hypothetical protein|tara:strand:+ start:3781 stop:3960 length:180 start_codon:yes stop_codon:yes gene_type:complete